MFTVEVDDKEYRVWFEHCMEQEHFWGVGATKCFIEVEDTLIGGVTFCSRKDQFDRRIGRKNALARATQRLDRSERKPIWDQYWRIHGRNRGFRRANK